MEESFESIAVKTRVLDQAGRAARWYRYRLPILIGTLVGLALFALYLTIVTVAQGWQHAVEVVPRAEDSRPDSNADFARYRPCS